MLEMICRNYNPGWLLLARWHMEQRTTDGYKAAKRELQRFLENQPEGPDAAEAWRLLAHSCYQLNDVLGEVHAFVERAQLSTIPFNDVSNTANRLNQARREGGIGKDEKRSLAQRLLTVMDKRRIEANGDDFSRMGWLALQTGQEQIAGEYAKAGLSVDPENAYCVKLLERLRAGAV